MDGRESLLEFPCPFPIKAVGLNDGGFENLVVELIGRHAALPAEGAVTSRDSRGGKYLSVTVTITATGLAQLDDIYRELSADKRVVMAL